MPFPRTKLTVEHLDADGQWRYYRINVGRNWVKSHGGMKLYTQINRVGRDVTLSSFRRLRWLPGKCSEISREKALELLPQNMAVLEEPPKPKRVQVPRSKRTVGVEVRIPSLQMREVERMAGERSCEVELLLRSWIGERLAVELAGKQQ